MIWVRLRFLPTLVGLYQVLGFGEQTSARSKNSTHIENTRVPEHSLPTHGSSKQAYESACLYSTTSTPDLTSTRSLFMVCSWFRLPLPRSYLLFWCVLEAIPELFQLNMLHLESRFLCVVFTTFRHCHDALRFCPSRTSDYCSSYIGTLLMRIHPSAYCTTRRR